LEPNPYIIYHPPGCEVVRKHNAPLLGTLRKESMVWARADGEAHRVPPTPEFPRVIREVQTHEGRVKMESWARRA